MDFIGCFGATGILKAKAGFFLSEARLSILLFFSSKGVAGSSSSHASASLPKLLVSSLNSSSSLDSDEGSFVFFLALLLCGDGSELGVLVSKSSVFLVFPLVRVVACVIVDGTSIFATSAITSLIGRC